MTNFSRPLAVIILAAGKGTRMNNPDKAKVMFEIAGKPLIDFVVRQAECLNPLKIAVVVGFKKESVVEYLSQKFPDILFAEQREQLGTGHAVRQAEPLFRDFSGDILILSGDVPLLSADTLQKFHSAHLQNNATVSVLSVSAPNPSGYGRIVRSQNGDFLRITEQKDASEQELLIDEINSGIYIVHAESLFAGLGQISNQNAQGEYYLTDIISVIRNNSQPVFAWKSEAFSEVQGINTVAQLAEAEHSLAELYGNPI